jgi:CheY-like chemotaxis protein
LGDSELLLLSSVYRLQSTLANGIIFLKLLWSSSAGKLIFICTMHTMKNLKILVIDDDLATCALLETILEMEDYQTASVNHVEYGITSLLYEIRPHVLIMDFHLGSHQTLQHIRAIRADVDWAHLPIVMTSAIDRKKECLAAGADKFILKPFDWQELIKIINQVVNT